MTRGLRLRGRHAAPGVGQEGRRPANDVRDDRTGLGRERGLARHRRRRDLRRLPCLVRDDVLGLLPRPPAHPRVPDRPRRLVRMAREGGPPPLADVLGVDEHDRVGRRPLLWGIALASLLHGVPSRPTRTLPAISATCSAGTRSSPGSPSACCSRFTAPSTSRYGRSVTCACARGERRCASRRRPRSSVRAFWPGRWSSRIDRNDKGVFPVIVPVAVAAIAAVSAVLFVRAAQEHRAFAATATTIVAVVVTLFVGLYPRVMVSDPSSRTASRSTTRLRATTRSR